MTSNRSAVPKQLYGCTPGKYSCCSPGQTVWQGRRSAHVVLSNTLRQSRAASPPAATVPGPRRRSVLCWAHCLVCGTWHVERAGSQDCILQPDSRPLPTTPCLHGRATSPFRKCSNHAVLPTIGILGGAEALPAARRAGCHRLVGLANLYQTLHHPGVGVILYRPELASPQAANKHWIDTLSWQC